MSLDRFPFIDRETEIEKLVQDFRGIIRSPAHRGAKGYLLEGRRGIGKSRLVEEFIRLISEDLTISAAIPNFKPEEHVIVQVCSPAEDGSFQSLSRVDERIHRLEKRFIILNKLKDVALAAANLKELWESLIALFQEVSPEEKSSRRQHKRQVKTYLRYQRGLRRLSRRAPLILHVKDAQWLDADSLKLLETILPGPQSSGGFWGVVFLEKEGVAGERAAATGRTFREMERRGQLTSLPLLPLVKGFEDKILSAVMGAGLFTVREYEHIFTHTDGLPGELQTHLEDWIKQGLLRQTERGWVKASDFEEQVQPPIKKLIDLIISQAEDGKIDAGERQVIQRTARMLGIPAEVYTNMIELVLRAQELGYKIEKRVYDGALSKHAFLAYDANRRQVVLELLDRASLENGEIESREINHRNLVNVRIEIIPERGILLIYDYVGNETLVSMIERARHARQRQALQPASQIAEGLQELHRNGFIHGFLHPEAIVVGEDGRVRVLGLDVCRAAKLSLDEQVLRRCLPYMAPEKVAGQPGDQRSDIYSFGMILHELLTGAYPFACSTAEEVSSARRNLAWMKFQDVAEEIRPILARCLHPDPRLRYDDMSQVLQDLRSVEPDRPPDQIPPPAPPERSPARSRRALAIAAVLFLVALGAYKAWDLWGRDRLVTVEENTALVQVAWKKPPSAQELLKPGMLDYLIRDDLMQSTDLRVVDRNEWELLRGGRRMAPEGELKVAIKKEAGEYVVDVDYRKKNGDKGHNRVKFAQVEALLQGNPTKVRAITAPFIDKPQQPTAFTGVWRAFTNFYAGELAWAKLDVVADSSYTAALSLDPRFDLATLRRVQVLRFNGQTQLAKTLVGTLRDDLTHLGWTDSMRAQAVKAGLDGDLAKEANILSGVYEKWRYRKEAAYDVAEAYYRACEIEDAIRYYAEALKLDQRFALAHNHIAYCYSHQGNHDLALKHFRTYVDLDKTANAYDSLGDGFMSAGLLDSAAVAKQTGVRMSSNVNYLHQSLCYINVLRGRLTEAKRNAEDYRRSSFAGKTTLDPEFEAQSLYLSALIAYEEDRLDVANASCQQAVEQFNPEDPVTRNHDLHWLHGLICLRLGDVAGARRELADMQDIAERYRIDATRYQMGLYKYMRHLQACLDVAQGGRSVLDRCVADFNAGLRDKVKDHSSPFDLAFFDADFARMYQDEFHDANAAQRCLDCALAYNPNYPPALFLSWKLHDQRGEASAASDARTRLDEVLRGADPEVRAKYGL